MVNFYYHLYFYYRFIFTLCSTRSWWVFLCTSFGDNNVKLDSSVNVTEGHECKERLQWTMSGISLLPKSGSTGKKKSKFHLSKRFKSLLSSSNRRVMVYLNGQHTNSHEVITDLKSMEDVSEHTLSPIMEKLTLQYLAFVACWKVLPILKSMAL